MCKILCSTGALLGKPNNRDYTLLESLSKQLTCDGFELMMYNTWYLDAESLLDVLIMMQLNIPIMHCDKHIGEIISKGGKENQIEAYGLFEMNCMIAQAIGAGKIVIHLWDGLTSDANFKNNLEAYPELNDISKSYNLELLVENVVCNQESPMVHWCELAEKYPDIHFVFDTKMAAFHRELDLLYSPEYAWLWKDRHICHYHINDYAGGLKDWENLRSLPMGEGRVDFENFFQHMRRIGYHDTFTVEATAFDQNGVVDTDMLNRQFQYIREAMA
ncbi:MAG: sugar phosphate isomerase/epimerase [Lachnospiraceae bacterium]|nr:sugar phosphate isomerase/epimerase [Lachnospiraceae bacterium]